MRVAQFQVLSAGPQVSFQDGGRGGHLRFGITASGPMDGLAHATGHAALGYNPSKVERTSIETSIGGLALKCTYGQTTFSVAGGDFQIAVDDRPLPSWCVATIGCGQTLTMKPGSSGSWCYLAFAGDLRAPSWLGHTATNTSSGLGGGMLLPGQTVHVAKPLVFSGAHSPIPKMEQAASGEPFRIVIGPQQQYFKSDSVRRLTDSSYNMTAAYDRMGAKLSGQILELNNALSIPSEPIIRGSMQVAGDGMPTVLLADHQASGGYPKIATMIGADIDRFVQLRAPSNVSFKAITPAQAIEAARDYQRRKSTYLDSLRTLHRSAMTNLLRIADLG